MEGGQSLKEAMVESCASVQRPSNGSLPGTQHYIWCLHWKMNQAWNLEEEAAEPHISVVQAAPGNGQL